MSTATTTLRSYGSMRLAASGGFRRPELRDIQRIVNDNADALLEAWNEHFAS